MSSGGHSRTGTRPAPGECNCLALRQAARHVTQFYDQVLAPLGLRATQYSILATLRDEGPLNINALASRLVMDRTTLGRNILPLERDGLIVADAGTGDRRRKETRLSSSGAELLRAADRRWVSAQQRFESAFGPGRASKLRTLLRDVVGTELPVGP